MNPIPDPSRRGFIQAAASLLAAGSLPTVGAASAGPRHYFVGQAGVWPVENPAGWALARRADFPELERARDGLATLDPADHDSITRLVLRRCPLSLVKVDGATVTAQQWTRPGKVDLRPFLKAHALARPDVAVTIVYRKKGITEHRSGNEFLYGSPIPQGFPVEAFARKRLNCFVVEVDDNDPAPFTGSGFGWPGVPDDSIPWRALKSVWRNAPQSACPNCDGPTSIRNFGYRQVSFFGFAGALIHSCFRCGTEEKTIAGDHISWMTRHLEIAHRPVDRLVFGARRPWKTIG